MAPGHTEHLIDIRPSDPSSDAVLRLLIRHFELMRATSPAESCHVLEPDALLDKGAVLLAAYAGETVLGVGALTEWAPGEGELKSMHTAAEARGRGIARNILRALIAEARRCGLSRLSLETGTAEEFAAARALYASEGFTDCPPFGDYTHDPLSCFMRLLLD